MLREAPRNKQRVRSDEEKVCMAWRQRAGAAAEEGEGGLKLPVHGCRGEEEQACGRHWASQPQGQATAWGLQERKVTDSGTGREQSRGVVEGEERGEGELCVWAWG